MCSTESHSRGSRNSEQRITSFPVRYTRSNCNVRFKNSWKWKNEQRIKQKRKKIHNRTTMIHTGSYIHHHIYTRELYEYTNKQTSNGAHNKHSYSDAKPQTVILLTNTYTITRRIHHTYTPCLSKRKADIIWISTPLLCRVYRRTSL